jgi:hypothetical protein
MVIIQSTEEESNLLKNYQSSRKELQDYFSVEYFYNYFLKCLGGLEFSENCGYESNINCSAENFHTASVTIITPKVHFLIQLQQIPFPNQTKKRTCDIFIKHITYTDLKWSHYKGGDSLDLDNVIEVKSQLNYLLGNLENVFNVAKRKNF